MAAWYEWMLVLGGCLLASGCASTGGSLADYANAGGSPVKTSCRGAYLVAPHPTESKLLVTPYFASGLYKAVCDGVTASPPAQNVTGVPFEEGAREYLVSVRNTPQCRITGGTRLTPAHSEFTYSCPTPPAPTPKKK